MAEGGGDSGDRRRTFQRVYELGLWGSAGDGDFFSGIGSRGAAADGYARQMGHVLLEHARALGRPLSIVDLGCGDWEIGGRLLTHLPDAVYIGCDIVPELVARNEARFGSERVSFQTLDLVRDPIPAGDVCLVRQVFQHLSNAEVLAALPKLTHPFVYVTESRPSRPEGAPNPDIPAGSEVRFDWRTGRGRGLELGLPPFNCVVQEVFRTASSGQEEIVTERLS